MADGSEIYFKVREIVRSRGHSESDTCRVFKDWHVELRVGSGHTSVWTSDGIVYLTMLEKPVYFRPGPWEDHLARLHVGQPIGKPTVELRDLLRAQVADEAHTNGQADGQGDCP